jgi:hypothetical protein
MDSCSNKFGSAFLPPCTYVEQVPTQYLTRFLILIRVLIIKEFLQFFLEFFFAFLGIKIKKPTLVDLCGKEKLVIYSLKKILEIM